MAEESHDERRPAAAVVVRISCDPELAELAADALWQAGTTAVAEEPVGGVPGVTGVAGHPGTSRLVRDVELTGTPQLSADVAPTGVVALTGEVPRGALGGLRSWCDATEGRARVEELALDPAWADAWCDHATAVRVGPLVLRPVWVTEPIGPGEIDLPLDPGSSFGSGSHPSTRGVLDAIVEWITGAERVLDVGSGSGVLSMAALLLGAGSAVGVDIDPAAGKAGRAAAELCGMQDRFEFRSGGLEALGGHFDLVLANMLIGAIESLGSDIRERCRPGGTIVLGGYLESQRDRALAAVQPVEVLSESVEDGWVTLVAVAC